MPKIGLVLNDETRKELYKVKGLLQGKAQRHVSNETAVYLALTYYLKNHKTGDGKCQTK